MMRCLRGLRELLGRLLTKVLDLLKNAIYVVKLSAKRLNACVKKTMTVHLNNDTRCTRLVGQELDCMKHTRFLLKFRPHTPSTCSLDTLK